MKWNAKIKLKFWLIKKKTFKISMCIKMYMTLKFTQFVKNVYLIKSPACNKTITCTLNTISNYNKTNSNHFRCKLTNIFEINLTYKNEQNFVQSVVPCPVELKRLKRLVFFFNQHFLFNLTHKKLDLLVKTLLNLKLKMQKNVTQLVFFLY